MSITSRRNLLLPSLSKLMEIFIIYICLRAFLSTFPALISCSYKIYTFISRQAAESLSWVAIWIDFFLFYEVCCCFNFKEVFIFVFCLTWEISGAILKEFWVVKCRVDFVLDHWKSNVNEMNWFGCLRKIALKNAFLRNISIPFTI